MRFLKKLGNFLISKKFWINFLLILIVWVGIIWGTMTYFNSYTKLGEAITVPNLVENKVGDIPALIGNRDLKYEIIDSIYNPNLVEGTILYQKPMATDSSGLKVKSGRTIRVRVSKRTRLVTVPMVVSKSQRFAEAMLTTKGLRTRIEYVASNEDQGSVMDQQYQGQPMSEDQRLPINSVIELTVGKRSSNEDMINVPKLKGLTIKEADDRLNGIEGLRLFPVYNNCLTQEDSLQAKIHKQTPVAIDSSKVPQGSTITVFAAPEQ
ncbi:MAG: PASTA domain-containing protein [Bacteroidota bacterium]